MALPPVIALTDGGIYENLGTEVLTKRTPLPGARCSRFPISYWSVTAATRRTTSSSRGGFLVLPRSR
jgi:hypothetical protein